MNGVGAVAAARLRRRFRSRRFIVLLVVYVVVLLALTGLAHFVLWAMGALANDPNIGMMFHSIVVYVVLLFAVVTGPALHGRALHRGHLDEAAADGSARDLPDTSATVRALGALLAECATSLVFVVIALPVLLVVAAVGEVAASATIGSFVILAVEVVLLAAICVGAGGLVARPAGAVAVAYAAVTVLVVGTVAVFAIVGNLVRHEVTLESRGSFSWSAYDDGMSGCDDALAAGASDCVEEAEGMTTCAGWQTTTVDRPRLDLVWWMLVPNPFVVIADATPATWQDGVPSTYSLFTLVTWGVRDAQVAGEPTQTFDSCPIDGQDHAAGLSGNERTASTWYLGVLVQAAIAAGLLVGAASRRRTGTQEQPQERTLVP